MAKKASLALSLGSDLVELRIDTLRGRASPSSDVTTELRPFGKKAIITVRARREGGGFYGDEAERLKLIASLAADIGPEFVDVELATVKNSPKWTSSLPEKVKLIVSWHDFAGTPLDSTLLHGIRDEALRLGSIAKIVTTAGSFDDNLRSLELLEGKRGKVVAFCMGNVGTVSRVISMHLGAPLAYASLPDEAIAPGQLSITTMLRLRGMVSPD